MAPGPRAQTPPGPPDALDSMLSSLLAGSGCAAVGSVTSAEELDALLGEMGADAELWHEPTLFGSLAPGLQCSEACKRPGQRCLDPAHLPNCTRRVPLTRRSSRAALRSRGAGADAHVRSGVSRGISCRHEP
jgi:hypothetical protein